MIKTLHGKQNVTHRCSLHIHGYNILSSASFAHIAVWWAKPPTDDVNALSIINGPKNAETYSELDSDFSAPQNCNM